ncbi:unnamed protein product, partial [Amoebophrya sp. A25]
LGAKQAARGKKQSQDEEDDDGADEERLFNDEYRPRKIYAPRIGEVFGWSVPIAQHSVEAARKHHDPGAAVHLKDVHLQLLQETQKSVDKKTNGGGATGQVVQVECGGMFSTVRTRDGSVYAWGSNEYGQVGCPGSRGGDVFEPTEVGSFPTSVVFVACGFEHCLCITKDGQLFAFGRNHFGQLGTGRGRDLFEPTLVDSLSADVCYAAAGEDHSACVLASGELYTW